jgi:hypothetical protein
MNLVDAALRRIASDLNRTATAGLSLAGSRSPDLLSQARAWRARSAAEPLEILPGLIVPVALTGHRIAVKLLARDDVHRPQDLADLRSMLTSATAEDLAVARTTVELIARRGFDRGRDLAGALADLLGDDPRP